MTNSGVALFSEDIQFEYPDQGALLAWISQVLKAENKSLGELSIVFCSDTYLLEVNKKYLNKDYFTDIITFDQSESPNQIQGDIFISIDRVKENSLEFEEDFSNELDRVIIHGILHLIGFGDKSEEEKAIMRKKEDACLLLRSN